MEDVVGVVGAAAVAGLGAGVGVAAAPVMVSRTDRNHEVRLKSMKDPFL